jgi:hypothetical protein
VLLLFLSVVLVVAPLGRAAVAIFSFHERTCAVVNGKMGCWGDGWAGTLGDGKTSNFGLQPGDMTSLKPISFFSGSLVVSQVSSNAQYAHTCVLFTTSQVRKEREKKK